MFSHNADVCPCHLVSVCFVTVLPLYKYFCLACVSTLKIWIWQGVGCSLTWLQALSQQKEIKWQRRSLFWLSNTRSEKIRHWLPDTASKGSPSNISPQTNKMCWVMLLLSIYERVFFQGGPPQQTVVALLWACDTDNAVSSPYKGFRRWIEGRYSEQRGKKQEREMTVPLPAQPSPTGRLQYQWVPAEAPCISPYADKARARQRKREGER